MRLYKRISYVVCAVLLLMSPSYAQTSDTAALSVDEIIDRVIANERRLARRMKGYQPLVETYIQNLTTHEELGAVPKSDEYFLGKLDLSAGVSQKSLLPEPGFAETLKRVVTKFYTVQYLPDGFAQMVLIDDLHFGRSSYEFEYVRQEFLGEVRSVVFEVRPRPGSPARFSGRIWVEDQDHNIVRFNGTYNGSSTAKLYFHFDSWRENLAPDVWLPTYVYSEESDLGYFFGQRKLRFKSQTRLWGYNSGRPDFQDEFTSLVVEADHVTDNGDTAEYLSPVLRLRAWERLAEDNILSRMQRAGLLAPEGPVDKILQTVITNLEVTNDIVIEPPVRARILLTSPLESFSVGHTIVISRGLIDVLPDEASLAMVLAHELAHIGLGHRLDTKYAFSDRMLFSDEEMFQRITLKRDSKEEREADEKAMEYLARSPYKDKLGSAGLFLRAVHSRSKQLSRLLDPHMGNRIARGGDVLRMEQLMESAPQLEPSRAEQVAALPLGGRLRVNPWNNSVELVQTAPVALLSAREKMPFEVTPVFLYLTRYTAPSTTVSNNN